MPYCLNEIRRLPPLHDFPLAIDLLHHRKQRISLRSLLTSRSLLQPHLPPRRIAKPTLVAWVLQDHCIDQSNTQVFIVGAHRVIDASEELLEAVKVIRYVVEGGGDVRGDGGVVKGFPAGVVGEDALMGFISKGEALKEDGSGGGGIY